MKKIISAILTAAMLACACFALAACGECEHLWGDGTVTTAATATADGVMTYTCTECGETKTEAIKADTQVTAEEWAAALALTGKNYSATSVLTYQGETQTLTNKSDGNIHYQIVTSGNVSRENYFVKEGENYYIYSKYTGGWEKVDSSEAAYTTFGNLNTTFVFTDFSYDETTKCYVADTLSNTTSAKDVSILFLDNKIVSITYKQAMSESILVDAQMTITYGGVALTAPEIAE